MRRSLPMILVRVVVGLVFLTEGILKFVHPAQFGVGRFVAIGIPFAPALAPLIGAVEIAGGLAILLNLFAGDAALVLLAVVLTALVTTKLPILLGHPLGPFALAQLPRYGLLSFLHEARVDLCMIFGLVAIAIDGGIRVGRRRPWYQSKEL
ncbi:MAG: DoxX family protein [Terracidiphilus sp.]|nr:DoxX family protein [Terracidiphilus sp.]